MVYYYSLKRDLTPHHVGVVTEVLPEGIPSCRELMIKIEGKSGYVLASHCRQVPERHVRGSENA